MLVFSAGNSQSRIGDFQSISSFTDIRSALFFNNLLVGVSKSGLIILNTEDESFETVSIDDGLSYLGLSHLHKDIKIIYGLVLKKQYKYGTQKKKF